MTYNVFDNVTFAFKLLKLNGLMLVTPKDFVDARGSFEESYKFSEFSRNDINYYFKQDNISVSKKGVLRGLHYQLKPNEQGKIVKVLNGEIFDVAVDIRKGSKTYGKWIGVRLSGKNGQELFIPPGFAHGFVALKDRTRVLYKVTNEYSPRMQRGIIWDDPKIGIKWPVKDPIITEKDRKLPSLDDAENNF